MSSERIKGVRYEYWIAQLVHKERADSEAERYGL